MFARDYLKGQAKNNKSPFNFIDMLVKQPWSSEWKTNCRSRIKGCDGVIVLLSKNTSKADGARWKMKCAIEEGIPILGIHIRNNDKGTIPSELRGKRVIKWTWSGIANLINTL